MLTFENIFGQDAALAALRRAYLADRLPHGLIFAGPVGVGKATTARALGGLFLCQKPRQDQPCGTCPACTVFATGNHPDWHVITKELIRVHDRTGKSKGIDLSINVLRPELIEPAGRKATMGVGKVFVIEQAELMNAQAQNSILKTLEEPAGRTIIILLTDQPLTLLPTIRSRCQVVRFAALDQALVRGELEKRGHSAADAADAAMFAEGSLGLALRWLEDGVVERARELLGRIEGLMAARVAPDLPDWFKQAADDYAARQLQRDELASKDQATREALSLYLRLAAQVFRRHLTSADDPETLEKLAGGIDAVVRADQYLDGNVNLSLIFQQFVVTLESLFAKPAFAGR